MSVPRALLFKALIVLFVLAFAELVSRVALEKTLPTWELTRRALAGEFQKGLQNMLGVSYLNYVPAPGHSDHSGLQHNAHGYRGALVPRVRSDNTLRILCLGGSTTYGWGTVRPEQAYPAHLRQVLGQRLAARYRQVEVLNAGLPWGTSAEILNHYHFKYHYYRPDLVVIHTGLNDAQAFDQPSYQPDYGHWRQQMPQQRALPVHSRWLLHSRAVSLVLIPALIGLSPANPSFNRWPPVPAVPWYGAPPYDRNVPQSVPNREIAFVHNVTTLVREIKRDGAAVLLMPVEFVQRTRTDAQLQQWAVQTLNSLRYTQYFSGLLRQIAQQNGATWIPFPHEKLAPKHWTDPMHLTDEGSLQKATHVARYVTQTLDAARAGPPH